MGGGTLALEETAGGGEWTERWGRMGTLGAQGNGPLPAGTELLRS